MHMISIIYQIYISIDLCYCLKFCLIVISYIILLSMNYTCACDCTAFQITFCNLEVFGPNAITCCIIHDITILRYHHRCFLYLVIYLDIRIIYFKDMYILLLQISSRIWLQLYNSKHYCPTKNSSVYYAKVYCF